MTPLIEGEPAVGDIKDCRDATCHMAIPIPFVRLHPDAVPPHRGSAAAAGWDLRSIERVTLSQGVIHRIPTGLAVAIPLGYEGQIRCRSGLASKGMMLPNGVGTIDADYRGELQVLATYLGPESCLVLEAGERVAQLVISPIPDVRFDEVESEQLPDTDRGEGGFGSTGRR